VARARRIQSADGRMHDDSDSAAAILPAARAVTAGRSPSVPSAVGGEGRDPSRWRRTWPGERSSGGPGFAGARATIGAALLRALS